MYRGVGIKNQTDKRDKKNIFEIFDKHFVKTKKNLFGFFVFVEN